MNLGKVYTKDFVSDYMVSLLSIEDKSKLIDPCFGGGVFINSILQKTHHNIIGFEIDKKAFSIFNNPNKERCNIFCQSFFSFTRYGTIDGIIMNPPYVRHEEIDQLEDIGVNKKVLKRLFDFRIPSQSNLYVYFVLHSIKLLKQGGEMIVIFPNTWLKTDIGNKFKQLILQECSISKLQYVKGNPFQGNPLVDVVIVKIIKTVGIPTESSEVIINNNKIILHKGESTADIIYEKCVNLEDLATIRRGITTGFNDVFINPKIKDLTVLEDIISSPKNIEGYSLQKSLLDKLLVINSDTVIPNEVYSYLTEAQNKIIVNRRPKTIFQKIVNNKKWYLLNKGNPGTILFPYIIRNNIRFIYNEKKILARDNFYIISSKIDDYLTIALLNNLFVYYQLELCGKHYGEGLLKIQKYDMDKLKIINPKYIDDDDITLLKNSAKILIELGTFESIKQISSILSKYYNEENISEIYKTIKKRRINK